jgi:hypothetical protein
MHRLIMTSSTYRQSSTISKAAQLRDPDNTLLSRMTLRRLDAESIRDSILQIASRLDDTPFGPPDAVQIRPDGLATVAETNRGWRRSIYVRQYRTELPTLLESFDLPQMSPNCVGRTNSTVAPQALQLLNDAQIYQLANHFAKRIARESGSNLSSQVQRAYQIALGRPPTDEEQSNAQSTLAELTEEWTKQYRQEIVAVESAAELWIRESTRKKVYEDDLIYIHSRAGRDKARRFSLVEFDLTTLPKLPLEESRLELSPVQASQRVRHSAAIIPHGIKNVTWQSFQTEKESSLDPLESLGTFDIAPNLAHVGRYCASESASSADLRKLEDLIAKEGRLALALMAPEDGNPYQAEWDDGKGVGTGGKRPRLVLRFKSPAATVEPEVLEKARESALTNYCHALLNSAELVYVD